MIMPELNLKKLTRTAIVLIGIAFGILTGCAKKPITSRQDPYESFNRKVFATNNVIDRVTLRPISITYSHIVPSPLKRMIHRLFANLDTIPTIINDLLQGRGRFAASDAGRLVFNSTIGIGGLFDPAKHMGLPPHNNDFGITLNHWGAKESPFMMMFVLGPSTYRDTFGSLFDLFIFSAWPYIEPKSLYYSLLALWIVDKRAQLLPADALINQSFDPYIFVRNAYLQMRQQKIADSYLSYEAFLQRHQQKQIMLKSMQPSFTTDSAT